MAELKLTPWQIKALAAAYTVSDGWLRRGCSPVWGRAPTAIMALESKGYLHMPHGGGMARLTPQGRALVEADPKRFGLEGKP